MTFKAKLSALVDVAQYIEIDDEQYHASSNPDMPEEPICFISDEYGDDIYLLDQEVAISEDGSCFAIQHHPDSDDVCITFMMFRPIKQEDLNA